MTRIIGRLDEIAAGYRVLLCDLWGCYHDGIRPYPAAVAALRAWRGRGGIVVLLTNAPRPAASVARFLGQIGAPRDTHDGIMSSGEACQRAIAAGLHGRRLMYLGPERDLHMLTDTGLDPAPEAQAEAVLCTGLRDDRRESPADYRAELGRLAARGLPMLCANPDIVVDRGAERLWCAGALAAEYEALGGRVLWFGKPHRRTYEQAMALVEEIAGGPVPAAQVLAIGDGVGTDVTGAREFGVDAVFVSGGLAAREVGTDPEHPDPGLLAAYLARHGEAPAYAIGRLR